MIELQAKVEVSDVAARRWRSGLHSLHLLVNAPNCDLSLVLASVVQGDAVNSNNYRPCDRI